MAWRKSPYDSKRQHERFSNIRGHCPLLKFPRTNCAIFTKDLTLDQRHHRMVPKICESRAITDWILIMLTTVPFRSLLSQTIACHLKTFPLL